MNKISPSSGCTFGSEQASLIYKYLYIFIYFLFCFLLFLFIFFSPTVFERARLRRRRRLFLKMFVLRGVRAVRRRCHINMSRRHPISSAPPVHSLTEATRNPPPPRDSLRNKQNRDKRRPDSCMSLVGGGGCGGRGGLKKIIQLFESCTLPLSPRAPPPPK